MSDFFNSIGNWFLYNWQAILKVACIVLFGIIIIKIILALFKRRFVKTKMDRTVQSFVLSVLNFLLYLILIVCVISSLGVSITGLTVVISAISLAITLALQDSLKNLVNGFIIISTKLIKSGDWVKIGDLEGTVIDVRMLYIILQTADNKKVTIPNSTAISSSIINYNCFKSRRLDIPFEIAYDSDVDLAKKVIFDVIDSCEMVFDDPKPKCFLSSLNQSSITLNLRIWCASSDYWETKWYLIDNVFNELKRNNITIPFNQLEVAIVDANKKSYVRKEELVCANKHKSKPEEDDDIITSINKTVKQKTSDWKKLRTKKKSKKNNNDLKQDDNKDINDKLNDSVENNDANN